MIRMKGEQDDGKTSAIAEIFDLVIRVPAQQHLATP